MYHRTIIAEIGQNWMGDRQLAMKLITEAKDNGADLVKFQLYDSRKLYGEFQYTEVSKADAGIFFSYGREVGIEVFFSVFDVERVKWCEDIGVKKYKIACSHNRDNELSLALSKIGKPVYVSMETTRDSLWFSSIKYELYCIPKYPTMPKDLNFSRLKDCDGFSDHTIGLNAAKIALARGTKIIEKHFAVDHKTGIDAEWSMTPSELQELREFANAVEEIC